MGGDLIDLTRQALASQGNALSVDALTDRAGLNDVAFSITCRRGLTEFQRRAVDLVSVQ
jgi:hypothetical protein